jgi:hypothetical protein
MKESNHLKKCLRCGIQFTIYSNQKNRTYCSKKCYRPIIPEQEVIRDYMSGKSCKIISERINCSSSTIRNVLLKNNISMRQGNSFYITCKRQTNFSEAQKNIIEGLLLGDGCIRRRGKTANLCLTTVEKEYADYISTVLPLEFLIVTEQACKRVIRHKEYNCRESYRAHSKTDISLNEFREKWYSNKIKIIPEDLILTPISVKHWFYGDGTSTYIKYKEIDKAYVVLSFCTNGFTVEDCNLLIEKLFQAIKIKFKIKFSRGKPILICRDIDSINTFFNYIGECDFPCYMYKWKKPNIDSKGFAYKWSTHSTIHNEKRNLVINLFQDPSTLEKAKMTGTSLYKYISKITGVDSIMVKNILGLPNDPVSVNYKLIGQLRNNTKDLTKHISIMASDPEIKKEAISLGISICRYIAKKINKGYTTIKTHMNSLGIAEPITTSVRIRERNKTALKEKEVTDLYNDPNTRTEALKMKCGIFKYISKKIGRRAEFVRSVMKKNGVPKEPLDMSLLKSGYGKGYDYNKKNKKWRVRLKGQTFGSFNTEEEAKLCVQNYRSK